MGDISQDRSAINFKKLAESITDFFASFENPSFLYKSAFKYWKTRFLREFYMFATSLSNVMGWYLQRNGESIPDGYVNAPTALKIINATRLAEELDKELKDNRHLREYYADVIAKILQRYGIDQGVLLLFGKHYLSEEARLLHGLLSNVLLRFSNCWEQIYNVDVREALSNIPKEKINFDATFRSKIKDTDTAQVVDELFNLRQAYLKYMSASAEVIDRVFPKGRVWSKFTVPVWLGKTLQPYYEK
jgi:hypothetical protein